MSQAEVKVGGVVHVTVRHEDIIFPEELTRFFSPHQETKPPVITYQLEALPHELDQLHTALGAMAMDYVIDPIELVIPEGSPSPSILIERGFDPKTGRTMASISREAVLEFSGSTNFTPATAYRSIRLVVNHTGLGHTLYDEETRSRQACPCPLVAAPIRMFRFRDGSVSWVHEEAGVEPLSFLRLMANFESHKAHLEGAHWGTKIGPKVHGFLMAMEDRLRQDLNMHGIV